ncbi:hypothetical protein [uncultured Clostridium sp.]|jgi:hypothetical protein|uniref:hypothetical protein n=1 Tax=uncultured Clostridium sp. TaxID=59620 RepID=UPI00261836BE|nr:hypothetical protein [uncultured Clostridium sp.]
MDKMTQVDSFIRDNILHSAVWDSANELQRIKAVNQSERTLKRYFSKTYKDDVPIEHLSHQAIWLLKIDDFIQRAELGATSISIDGISIAYSQKDRSVCPFIMEELNLSEGWNLRRKVGRYSTSLRDSNRKGW